jgi:hypothetical protein
MPLPLLQTLLHRSAWILAFLSGFLPAASILPGVQVFNAKVEYTFGEKINFQAQVLSDAAIKTASILIRAQGSTDTLVEPIALVSQNLLTYTSDLSSRPLRAFARIDYWFILKTEDGKQFTSPVFNFYYEDNRYTWQVLVDKPFVVHWYEGNEAFAQDVLDVAHQGLQRISSILPLQAPAQVDIYVYASLDELQKTLSLTGRNWEAGHADPDLGVMVVALPVGPDQGLVTEERVPHELMHIMLFQSNPAGYNNLPVWFNEGLASISELVPNPDYQVLLETAVKKDTLIPIASLCRSFPTDLVGAQLSYAEAADFTRYLYHKYGSTGLQSLIGGYADGLECSRAVEVSFNASLPRIESDWRATILSTTTPTEPSPQVWPWFILLGVILVIPLMLALVGLSKRRPGVLPR